MKYKRFFTNSFFCYLFALGLILPHSVQAQEPVVSFSCPGGFYDNSFILSLSCPDSLSIHYTLNGNIPTVADMVYQRPLTLDDELFSKSNIHTIQTCHDSIWHPANSVQKCIIVRASAFDLNGDQVGETITNSYFIKSLGCNSHGLPIVSICVDSLSLFDQEYGIMATNESDDTITENYMQRGRQWERLCNLEFYELNNDGINQNAGLRIHGESSRWSSQKGLRLYARKEYGQKRFRHEFFGPDELDSFKHLVLKPLKNGLLGEHICTPIAKSLNVDAPAVRPTILFLNGEYWGIYYLEERTDAQFLADHYGYRKNDINVIESWKGKTVDGNNDSFLQMIQWFDQADLSDEEAYRQACSLIDIDCFIDYYCLELYAGNDDWPMSNMKCWQAENGKWRWIFTDGDGCLCGYRNMWSGIINNTNKSTLIFDRLLENQDFRDQFYSRFGRLIINEFEYKTTKKFLENSYVMVTDEVDRHIARFGMPDSREEFEFHKHEYINTFLYYRPLYVSRLLYYLFYINDWEYRKAAKASQYQFKYNPNKRKPVYLLHMARQLREWKYVKLYNRYVKLYHKYKRSQIKAKWKSRLQKVF